MRRTSSPTDRLGARLRTALLAVVAAVTAIAPFAASVATAPPAAAWPAPNVTFYGHGYGHGRGLGQWGAYGYATIGASDLDIRNHYYGGTVDSQGLSARSVTL